MKTKLKTPDIINIAALIFAHIAVIAYITIKYSCHTDSDMASELILGKQLSEESIFNILSRNWCYSTELRVVNTQLVYKLLFLFTDNFKLVRIASCAVFDLMFTASSWMLCRSLNIRKWFPFVAICTIFPLSWDYYKFVTFGAYYVPHIIFGMVSVSLIVTLMNADKPKRTPAVILAILGFSGSLGGIRLIVTCFAPLFLTTALLAFRECYQDGMEKFRKSVNFRLLSASALSLAAAGCGYLVNSVILSRLFNFYKFNINFTKFNADTLWDMISGYAIFFGFRYGKVGASSAICAMLGGILLIAAIFFTVRGIVNYRTVSREYHFVSLFTAVNTALSLVIYTMTDMTYTHRYNFMALIFTFPVIAMGLKEADLGKLPKSAYRISAVFCGAAVCIISLLTLQDLRSYDNTRNYREIADIIIADGAKNGYASFWNCNIMTELTNGQIEMYSWQIPDGKNEDDMSNITDPTALCGWLQRKDHLSAPAMNDVLIILNRKEFDSLPWNGYLTDDRLIFSNEEYLVYKFDDISRITQNEQGGES